MLSSAEHKRRMFKNFQTIWVPIDFNCMNRKPETFLEIYILYVYKYLFNRRKSHILTIPLVFKHQSYYCCLPCLTSSNILFYSILLHSAEFKCCYSIQPSSFSLVSFTGFFPKPLFELLLQIRFFLWFFHLRHAPATDGKGEHEVTLQLGGNNGQKDTRRENERGIPCVWVTLWEPPLSS